MYYWVNLLKAKQVTGSDVDHGCNFSRANSPAKSITEAYRSLEGGLIQKAGVKPVQTVDGKDFEGHLSVKFHRYEDGVLVMEYRKPSSKQPHYELVDEIPKQAIPGSENPDDPLLLDIWKGFYDGAGKSYR
ncbi:hypothetical protein ABER60_00045 [Heyndrickxia coagulans]|uniref:hypothetical protein n=1 Tax=Heyndrickxia coagulans TaxID=1398 RepID=UPI001F466F07|nr:hypothetical protein [Heyndrickxia coagulans]